MSLIIKIILLGLESEFSVTFQAKTQYFVHLSFNSTLQLINDISTDLKKLPRYFNHIVIVEFIKVIFAQSANLIPNDLALYLKELKVPIFTVLWISCFILVCCKISCFIFGLKP